VIAQVFFAPMIKRGATHDNPTPWIHGVMQIFALFMFLGMLTSLLVPEGKNASLEALSGEEERGPYELQFRSGFYRARSAGSGADGGNLSGGLGEGMRDRGYSRAVIRGSVETGQSSTVNVEKGKWWKLV
jgi:PHS family inorganic phosphate transporter-like MFS transporter